MAYTPSLNNLTGTKPQGYTVPNKNTGKVVQIEIAKTAALKNKTAPQNGTGGNYKFSKTPSNGTGVGG